MKIATLKILILGGTHFLGIHLTEELVHRGHEVTLFNRGNRKVDSPIQQLQGDRDGNLETLRGYTWDAVIDTSGHLPRIVEQSTKVLSNATNHYTFLSTIGVYKNFEAFDIDEHYPLATIADPTTEEITEKTYGALKGLCEAKVQQYFPNHSLVVRSGLLVGPYERRSMPGFSKVLKNQFSKCVAIRMTHPSPERNDRFYFRWDTMRGEPKLQAGLDAQKKTKLLAQWKESQKTRVVIMSTPEEREAATSMRQKYFFDRVPIKDPYLWTFTHKEHLHFILYRASELVGYAHVQLWPNHRAVIRIIVIDEQVRGQGMGKYLMDSCEQALKEQGITLLQTEASPNAYPFYKKLGYIEMPFNNPDGESTHPDDRAMGKYL